MKRTTCKQMVESYMNDTWLLSAHTLAKMSGYSPQHINRCFKELYKEGKLAYTVEPHQGNSGFARKWCGAKWTHMYPDRKFSKPEYIQVELPL